MLYSGIIMTFHVVQLFGSYIYTCVSVVFILYVSWMQASIIIRQVQQQMEMCMHIVATTMHADIWHWQKSVENGCEDQMVSL